MLTAINDTGATCQGKPFSRCVVLFKGKPRHYQSGRCNLSQLVNPVFVRTNKGKVLCYCDPVVCKNDKQARFFEELKTELKNPMANVSDNKLIKMQEEMDRHYDYEREEWAENNLNHRNADRSRLALAIQRNYPCDNEYFAARMEDDFPGFAEVDHRMFFYEPPCPTKSAMEIEQIFDHHIGQDNKYNTYTRVALLTEHDGQERDEEILIIFNFLGRWDIYIPINKVTKDTLPRTEEEEEGDDYSYDEYY